MSARSKGKKTPTIVSPHKRIAIAPPHLAVDKLSRALKRDVHVAVDGLELARVSSRVSIMHITE